MGTDDPMKLRAGGVRIPRSWRVDHIGFGSRLAWLAAVTLLWLFITRPAEGADKKMTSPPTEPSAAPVRLELQLAPGAKDLESLRFSARYTAKAPVRLFHRMLSGFPDELRLVFTDAAGKTTVVDRVALSFPIVTRVGAQDFVTVGPTSAVAFDFPFWGDPKLEPGVYSLVAEHVGGTGTYTTDDGTEVDAGAYTGRIVSTSVTYHHQ